MTPRVTQITEPPPGPTPPPTAEPVLPPRPNLGPEPWLDSSEGNGWGLVFLGLILLVALASGLWMRWRRNRRRAQLPESERGQNRPPAFPSPIDHRIRRAERLRDALITAFGPNWSAKTTEEIAADPALLTRLGPERSARVVAILADADRAKFAGSSSDERSEAPPEADDRELADLISTLTSPSTGPGR
ncbi:hypothetical protein [Tautonia marina]|uniref:hypothetical protein n=1 Tax=Tautonia marina TaxID=2653855 RepID=UPI001261333C|nr:hypothetical protein [Tautonia marina]